MTQVFSNDLECTEELLKIILKKNLRAVSFDQREEFKIQREDLDKSTGE